MNDIAEHPALTVRGQSLSVKDFLKSLKTAGVLGGLIDQVVRQALIVQLAHQRQTTATTAELQQAADAFRSAAGLHQAEQTAAWLQHRGMTADDLERSIELRVLERKLQDQLAPKIVAERFEVLRPRFDRARLAHILVQQRGLADELACRLQEGTASFAELAREFSIDDATRDNAGFLGLVPRTSLAAATAEAVFNAKPGDVVGPCADNGHFQILQVRELLPARLDAGTDRAVRAALLDDVVRSLAPHGSISVNRSFEILSRNEE